MRAWHRPIRSVRLDPGHPPMSAFTRFQYNNHANKRNHRYFSTTLHSHTIKIMSPNLAHQETQQLGRRRRKPQTPATIRRNER